VHALVIPRNRIANEDTRDVCEVQDESGDHVDRTWLIIGLQKLQKLEDRAPPGYLRKSSRRTGTLDEMQDMLLAEEEEEEEEEEEDTRDADVSIDS